MESIEELLVSAVNRCDKNTISCLLAQGANANVVCASGRTALGFAAEMGNIAILKMLLEVSSVSSSLHQEDEHGQHQQKRHKGRKSRREHSHDASGPGNVSRGRSRLGRQVETVCDFPLQRLPANSNSPSDKDSEPNKNNLGYFIVVHNDGAAAVDDQRTRSHEGKVATALNDIQTPDGMEKLEWDSEMDDSDKGKDMGDDAWASLYRWYADILDRTSSLLQLPQNRDINQQDTYGRCAVHYAAEHGHVEALRLLRAAGCRMDVSDTDNFTPLHLAASRDHYHVVQLLLDAGVEVNRKTSDKTSALHIAASRGFVDTVWVLIDHGASIDSLDASDRTPLMLAVSRGHEDVVALLIKHGAKVNIEEIHGYTPLCEAVWQKLVPLVQLLLDAGAKITQSHYLLHYAVMHRHIEMARLLIQAGSIVNLRDDNGDTPLIVAARTGVCELAKLLLENVTHARSGWKTLRDYFHQEINKIEKPRSGTGGEGTTTSSWQFFQLMSFLCDTMISEARSSSLGVSSFAYSLSAEVANEVVPRTQKDGPTPPSSETSPQEEIPLDVSSVSTQSMHREKRKRSRPDIDAMLTKNEALIAIEKQKLEFLQKDIAEEKDDDLMFLKSLLPDLKSLPRSCNRAVRLKFQEIICSEIDALERQPHSFAPKPTEGTNISTDGYRVMSLNPSFPSDSLHNSL
ncbi:ankyrin-3 isoform X1 [Anabrus simplex]|uniref:ankyrin-3 isoform X1 n=1 Tax=Anabrus simplex TaxID=316456 RepID=UPI0035A308CC